MIDRVTREKVASVFIHVNPQLHYLSLINIALAIVTMTDDLSHILNVDVNVIVRLPVKGTDVLMMPADPTVTLNIYCEGLSERLVETVLAPLGDGSFVEGSTVWMMRYFKRGEHLKVRLHVGPADRRAALQWITGQVDRCVRGSTEEVVRTGTREKASMLKDVDPEDGLAGYPPRGTVLPTTWSRNPIHFLQGVWRHDDEYIARTSMANALGLRTYLSCKMLLPSTEPLLCIAPFLVAIRAALTTALQPHEINAYLRFHRDALLRQFAPGGQAQDRLLQFERMRSAYFLKEQQARAANRSSDSATATGHWSEAIGILVAYARRVPPALDGGIDGVLFKALHNLANVFSIWAIREASLYDYLLHARL